MISSYEIISNDGDSATCESSIPNPVTAEKAKEEDGTNVLSIFL